MPKEKGRALLIARRATVSDLRPRSTAILSDIGVALEGRDSQLFVARGVLSNESHRVFGELRKTDFFAIRSVLQANTAEGGRIRVAANPTLLAVQIDPLTQHLSSSNSRFKVIAGIPGQAKPKNG